MHKNNDGKVLRVSYGVAPFPVRSVELSVRRAWVVVTILGLAPVLLLACVATLGTMLWEARQEAVAPEAPVVEVVQVPVFVEPTPPGIAADTLPAPLALSPLWVAITTVLPEEAPAALVEPTTIVEPATPVLALSASTPEGLVPVAGDGYLLRNVRTKGQGRTVEISFELASVGPRAGNDRSGRMRLEAAFGDGATSRGQGPAVFRMRNAVVRTFLVPVAGTRTGLQGWELRIEEPGREPVLFRVASAKP